jgi:phosphomannomutase
MRGLRLGLATDGDADRFAVVDADGRLLSETQSLALLVDHLARTGRIEKGVAVSNATGSLVAKIATDHGLDVARHPIGFSELSNSLNAGDCDVAGEESGGFALASFSRDKDGVMASALMLELLAEVRAPLQSRLDEFALRYGASACGRTAVRMRPEAREALEELLIDPPEKVDGQAVRRVSTADGLHLGLDDGFLMLRVSGTEPVLRVYAEAHAEASLRRRLAFGAGMLVSADA